MHRIIQAGLIDYWMGELISVKARQSRKERRAKNPDRKQDNRFETVRFKGIFTSGWDRLVFFQIKDSLYMQITLLHLN